MRLVDGELTADISWNTSLGGDIYCALYNDNGVLLSVKKIEENKVCLDAGTEKAGYIKAFLWGGENGMTPLSAVFEERFSEIADKTELNNIIKLYNKIDVSVYDSGVDEFCGAMEYVKILSEDGSVIQKTADEAVSALIKARGNLAMPKTEEGGRIVINQNPDWFFAKEKNVLQTANQIQTLSDDTLLARQWTKLDLPHTWNAQDGTDGGRNYDRCVGWYRKMMYVDDTLEGKEVYLEFGAAGTACELYINGLHVPYTEYDIYSNGNETEYRHRGGYGAFRFNITDYVNYGEGNLIAVLVDNTRAKDISPLEGDFNMQGGLYRGVKLVAVNKIHADMEDYGSSGVYVTPEKHTDVTDNENRDFDLSVASKIINDSGEDTEVTVTALLRHPDHYDIVDNDYIKEHLRFAPDDMYDPNGTQVARFDAETVTIPAGGRYDYSKQILVENPRLWNGLEDPYRYEVVLTVESGGEVLEEITTNVGFKYVYTPVPEADGSGSYTGGGFYLNGNEYILRGAGKHQDRGRGGASLGCAVTNKERAIDCGLMYELGMNSVRLVHYQHSLDEIDMYDRLGILVWSELGLMGYYPSESTSWYNDFMNVTKAQFTEMIKQQYNNPSVFAWSMSNELREEYDENLYLISSTDRKATTGVKLHEELYKTAKEIDPVRSVTYANFDLFGRTEDWDSDIAAMNFYPYWYNYTGSAAYYGDNTEPKDMFLYHYDKLAEKKPFTISEYGGSAVVGDTLAYDADGTLESMARDASGRAGQYSTTYQAYLHEKVYSRLVEDMPFLWGSYVWHLVDSQSDKKGGKLAGMNDKGLVSYDHITKKDSYYFYKANWNDIEPFAHIVNKDRKEGSGIIRVYSNCDMVQLYVNGEKYGEPITDVNESDGVIDGYGVFMWYDVEFANETNSIEVKGVGTDGAEISGAYDLQENAAKPPAIEPEPQLGANLALNKATETSSVEKTGFEGDKAVDGIKTTAGSNSWKGKNTSGGDWITVDLGEVCELQRIDIYWEEKNSRVYPYEIFVSEDNEIFTSIVSGSGTNKYSSDILEETKSGRYVKISVGDIGRVATIREIEIYGPADEAGDS